MSLTLDVMTGIWTEGTEGSWEDAVLDPPSNSAGRQDYSGPQDYGLLADLASALANSAHGLAFVYGLLDVIVERWALGDAVIVVDTDLVGRQAFRAGRRWLDGWAEDVALTEGPGIYTDPPVLAPAFAASLVDLATVALRLDVLNHNASHDTLTGLHNRRWFDDALAQALARSRRYGWSFSLTVLDLNRLKAINDTLGHTAGDQVIRATGAALSRCLRAGDVAARLGGDEFGVILAEGDEAAGFALAGRVAAAVNAELSWANVGFAAGTATAPDETVDAEQLCRLADERLYVAKGRRVR
jgi:diguanylate cyclase (GGDEF)-like protein